MGYNTVLKAFGNIGDIENAELFFERMVNQDKIEPNSKTFGKMVFLRCESK